MTQNYKKAIEALQEDLSIVEKETGKGCADYKLLLQELINNCNNDGNIKLAEEYKKKFYSSGRY